MPAHPRPTLTQLRKPLGLGALGGIIASVVVAIYIGGVPADDEQRIFVSAVAFLAMIGTSVVVAAIALIWLVAGRSASAAIIVGFTVLLPVSSILTGLMLWR